VLDFILIDCICFVHPHSKRISGLNVSQYSSSSSYQTALVGTIVQAFTFPTINSSQVTNLLVSAATSSGRRLSASSPSIVASHCNLLHYCRLLRLDT